MSKKQTTEYVCERCDAREYSSDYYMPHNWVEIKNESRRGPHRFSHLCASCFVDFKLWRDSYNKNVTMVSMGGPYR